MATHHLAQLNVGHMLAPAPHAFSFRSLFPAPDASDATLDALPDECPAT